MHYYVEDFDACINNLAVSLNEIKKKFSDHIPENIKQLTPLNLYEVLLFLYKNNLYFIFYYISKKKSYMNF